MGVVSARSAERKPVEPTLGSLRWLLLLWKQKSLLSALGFDSDDGRLSAGELLLDAILTSFAICVWVV